LTNGVRDEYCSSVSSKDPFGPREVIGRRNRPAKAPLDRDAIVEAALDLLAREGASGLSLRKVAQALDTGAASLYVYVEGLPELEALVLDRALGDVALPARRRGPFRQRLAAVLRSYLDVLYRRPGLAQLAMRTMAVGPHGLGIVEALLGLFEEAGLAKTTAAWAVDLVMLHATAIAAEQSNWRERGDVLGPVARAIEGVSKETYPHIHALRGELMSGTPSTRLPWAMDVLINGLLATPAPAGGPGDDEPAP
jgi:AcrR family transcriptional regulator